MIFLKKYFQNQKGLQKLDTKNVPHAPKEYFQKNKKIFFFQKRGLRGSKKIKEKNSYLKWAFKNHLKPVPHCFCSRGWDPSIYI